MQIRGCQTSAPPHRPRTCSQTKALANAAIRAPHGPIVSHTQPQPRDDPKYEELPVPDLLCDLQSNNKPRIVPIVTNLRPQYPTKHEGLLEDPFPLIQSANSVTDLNTGKQLEYKQLINHPDRKLCQTWQCSSANEFRRLVQGVSGWIAGTETIKFLQYNEMLKDQ